MYTFRWSMAGVASWLSAWLVVACVVASPAAAQAPTNPNLNAQLLVAARQSDAARVERALAQGAAPNSRNRLGKTALLMAAEKGDLALAERLLAAGSEPVNQLPTASVERRT